MRTEPLVTCRTLAAAGRPPGSPPLRLSPLHPGNRAHRRIPDQEQRAENDRRSSENAPHEPHARMVRRGGPQNTVILPGSGKHDERTGDRKSTRLNSSHGYISYAVFCLKKKKK